MSNDARHVLVVEDDSSQQLMYKRALRTMNFEVVCVGTTEAARLALSRTSFAIVILDLQLRGEVSLDFFEEIRDAHPAVSVIIATGHGSFEFARRSIHMDVVDFLAKPIPLTELKTALDRAWLRHVLVHTPVAKLLLPHVEGEPVNAPQSLASNRPELLASRKNLNIEAMERELIMEALWRSGDNRKVAAEMLGISERKLYYRLTQYEVR